MIFNTFIARKFLPVNSMLLLCTIARDINAEHREVTVLIRSGKHPGPVSWFPVVHSTSLISTMLARNSYAATVTRMGVSTTDDNYALLPDVVYTLATGVSKTLGRYTSYIII